MDHKDMILHLMVVIKEARSLQMPMWLLNSFLAHDAEADTSAT